MKNLTRNDFPFIQAHPDWVYFDNAATSLKPQVVLDALMHYYTHLSANIHRGDYPTSVKTSEMYEKARKNVADLFNVSHDEIVWTSGASESLNLVARGYGAHHLRKGDGIILSENEHASNVLPWYALAKEKDLEIIFFDLHGDDPIRELEQTILKHPNARLVSFAHASNVLGYLRPVKELAFVAKKHGLITVVDGAQVAGHAPVDLRLLNVDFYAFSAHKMLGPSGLGVLYGKKELLEAMLPLHYGGGSNVDFNQQQEYALKKPPHRFESGTPAIESVLAFSKAIDYLKQHDLKVLYEHTKALSTYAYEKLSSLSHVNIYNPYSDLGIISFNVEGIFAQDVAFYLGTKDIFVRAGDHCAKMLDLGGAVKSSVRMSLYFYNTYEEIDRLYDVLSDITLEKCIDAYI